MITGKTSQMTPQDQDKVLTDLENRRKIDRQTIVQIDELERSLSMFHGFRHLWAELVSDPSAPKNELGMTTEQLEKKQVEALSGALGYAYTIAEKWELKWFGSSKERDFIRELAEEGCSYGDNCPSNGVRHGKCLSCKAKEALEI